MACYVWALLLLLPRGSPSRSLGSPTCSFDGTPTYGRGDRFCFGRSSRYGSPCYGLWGPLRRCGREGHPIFWRSLRCRRGSPSGHIRGHPVTAGAGIKPALGKIPPPGLPAVANGSGEYTIPKIVSTYISAWCMRVHLGSPCCYFAPRRSGLGLRLTQDRR